MNYKNEIAKRINAITNVEVSSLEEYIEIPPNTDLGDFAFPCFKLAKELRKAPPAIATELKEKLAEDEVISKIDVVGGYLNFFINKSAFAKNVVILTSQVFLYLQVSPEGCQVLFLLFQSSVHQM